MYITIKQHQLCMLITDVFFKAYSGIHGDELKTDAVGELDPLVERPSYWWLLR